MQDRMTEGSEIWWILPFIFLVDSFAEAEQCLKNKDIGLRQGNPFRCDDPDKPFCCEVDHRFTCCGSSLQSTVVQQLQLWGVVSLFVVIMAAMYVYMEKDVQLIGSSFKASVMSILRRNNDADYVEPKIESESNVQRTTLNQLPLVKKSSNKVSAKQFSYMSYLDKIYGKTNTEDDGWFNIDLGRDYKKNTKRLDIENIW